MSDFSASTSAETAALGVLAQIVALPAGKVVKLLNILMKIVCVVLYIGFTPPKSTHSEWPEATRGGISEEGTI